MMEHKTLSEASKILGISKQAISQYIKRHKIETWQEGRVILIPNEVIQNMRETRKNKVSDDDCQPNVNVDVNVDNMFIKDLEFLREQIKEKDKQIAELQKALDQQQQLHGISMQRIKQLENKIQLLEHQPSEQVNDMIDMLEKTRDSFLANIQILHQKQNKSVSGSFYQRFAKAS
ncbi:MAG: DUF536 domain-containing protein [SAR324 cluster bacterium]|nr:DUF536 domain-containing protein [SAR324 cluster bacterium]